jgi:cellulose synthase/poly-beta-1,6-N-acetylglucosamine synthase-like glycosyltransferase
VDRREILVVDNGSTDATAAIARAHPVTCIHEPTAGVSNARNRGIEAASGEIVAFLDSDCIVIPGWMREITAPFADPAVGAVGGELEGLPPQTAAERQTTRLLGRWQRAAMQSDPPYAITANAAYRLSVLRDIGGFDPRMPRAQDVELGHRFHNRSDLKVAFAPGAIARHRHATTARAFFRQQLGWAYGAGLLAARRIAAGEEFPPPRLAYVLRSAQGIVAVLMTFPRGYGQRIWIEDAWFNFLRNLSWWLGLQAGRIRGRVSARAVR